MLAQGDVTKHAWIYHNVTLRQAALYAKDLVRRAREAAYNRQKLYEVINRSLGGDFVADATLLADSAVQAGGERGRLAQWVKLAHVLGCPVPEAVMARFREAP